MILGTIQQPFKLAPGQAISEDGVYDLTMERYHDQPCIRPSISSSGLRTLWSSSPKHFWKDSKLNPAWQPPSAEDDDERPHFTLGRAAHQLLFLGRAAFDREYVVRPVKWTSWVKEAKAWRTINRRAGLTAITPEEVEQIAGMAKALEQHPLVKAGILDGAVERSMVFRCPRTGLFYKSRPDNVTMSSGDFSDLKGTSKGVSADAIQRTLKSYQYHMQGGLVGMGAERCLGVTMTSFTLVFVEFKPPHCVEIVTIPDEDIARGREQCEAMMEVFATCLRNNEWPGPGGTTEDAKVVGLDRWERERIDQRLELLKQTHPQQPHPIAAE